MTSLPANRSILILEDEPSFREVLELGLSPHGFNPETVGTLEGAKLRLKATAFDAVVSDLRLKDGSGIDLLTWMKEQGIETPVVIMTAFATTETTVQALNLGAVDFLTKAKNDIQELTKVLQGLFVKQALPMFSEITDLGDLVGVGDTMRKVQALSLIHI